MATGNTQNNTAREINNAVYQKHGKNAEAQKLRQQWIDKGLDRKMSFNQYLKQSRPKYQKLYSTNNDRHFTSGKYAGKFIGKVANQHPEYIEWILVNAPTSKLGKQIITFFNRYPAPKNKVS